MDYSKLSQVAATPRQKVSDSATRIEDKKKYLSVKQKLSDSIKDKSAAEIFTAAKEMLKDSAPEHVIRALVSLLSKKDSAPTRKKYAEFKVADTYQQLKKKIKDDLLETETTDAAIEAVEVALENAAPEEVLAAAVEILSETVDVLQEQIDQNPPVDPAPEEEYIEDSVTHKGKLRVKDSFNVGELFEGNGVTGKIKEVKEDSIIVETQNEDGDVEDKEVKISDIC